MTRLLRLAFLATVAGSIALAASLVSTASADGPALTVESLESNVGGVAKVEVRVADVGSPGIGAWTIDLHFDSDVISGIACTAGQGGSICNPTYSEGVARIVGTNIYGLEGDALLASIGFACKSEGETSLDLSYTVFVDATPGNPTDIDAKIVNGTADCKPSTRPPGSDVKVAGDANCDGAANAIDASLVLQFVAGLVNSLPCADADFDHNGRIDALDAALILQTDAGLIP
jgi:hypothetical protein